MRIKTICAWCGALISEKKYPDTKYCQSLSKNGVMTSHGLCSRCRKNMEVIYGLNKNGGNKNV